MLRVSPVALAIREQLLTVSASCDDALTRCASDLHLAHRRIWELEARLEREERDVSAGYKRRAPSHRARQPKPQIPDPVDDSWIRTGAAGDAS